MRKLKPLKKMLAVNLLVIWLATPTLAQTKDTIIDQGTPAPFRGVLVPEEHYRYYQEKSEIADVLTQKSVELPIVDPKLEVDAFFGGAAIGAIATVIAYLVFRPH